MIAEIHVSPSPAGTSEDRYAHVEAAIAVIQASGLRYEVGGLGTTFEGEPEDVWAALRAAHEAVIVSGADGLITSIRLGQHAVDDITIDALTAKFRT